MATSTLDQRLSPRYPGEIIRRLREHMGMSQTDLATRLTEMGVPTSPAQVSSFEMWGSDKPSARKPSWARLWAMSAIFDVRLSELGANDVEYPELALVRRGLATLE